MFQLRRCHSCLTKYHYLPLFNSAVFFATYLTLSCCSAPRYVKICSTVKTQRGDSSSDKVLKSVVFCLLIQERVSMESNSACHLCEYKADICCIFHVWSSNKTYKLVFLNCTVKWIFHQWLHSHMYLIYLILDPFTLLHDRNVVQVQLYLLKHLFCEDLYSLLSWLDGLFLVFIASITPSQWWCVWASQQQSVSWWLSSASKQRWGKSDFSYCCVY